VELHNPARGEVAAVTLLETSVPSVVAEVVQKVVENQSWQEWAANFLGEVEMGADRRWEEEVEVGCDQESELRDLMQIQIHQRCSVFVP